MRMSYKKMYEDLQEEHICLQREHYTFLNRFEALQEEHIKLLQKYLDCLEESA